MKKFLIGAGLAAALAAGPAVFAVAADTDKAGPDATESPKQLLDDAGQKFLRAIELMLRAIPQYEAPEILDNGDIVIRRKRPAPSGRQDAPPDPAPRGGIDRT